LLDKYRSSGRYFVDIEELIGDKPLKMEGSYNAQEFTFPELTVAQMQELASPFCNLPSGIDTRSLEQVVEAGIAAPSAANNQPWKLLSKNSVLFLFHDKKQSYSWTDKEHFIARIGLGAALENIVIKAASLGYAASWSLFPAGEESPLVAAITFEAGVAAEAQGALAAYIGQRCTNRKRGDNSPIEQEILSELTNAGLSVPGTDVRFLTDPDFINTFADIESAAERIRSLHPQSHYEFFHKELRWNHSGKEIIDEGLDIKTLELTVAEEMGIKIGSDPAVIAVLNEWKQGKVFEKLIRLAIRSSSAVGLVTVPRYAPSDIVTGGRAVEQIWLTAAKYNLSVQPVSAPLFLHATATYADMTGEDANMIVEIKELYGKLCILFPDLLNRHGIFLFRLFKAEPPTARSLRKSIDELYTIA
jgi:hypothetical protein